MSIQMTIQNIYHVLHCATACVAVTIELTISNFYYLLDSGLYNEYTDDYSDYLPCVAVYCSVCCSDNRADYFGFLLSPRKWAVQ